MNILDKQSPTSTISTPTTTSSTLTIVSSSSASSSSTTITTTTTTSSAPSSSMVASAATSSSSSSANNSGQQQLSNNNNNNNSGIGQNCLQSSNGGNTSNNNSNNSAGNTTPTSLQPPPPPLPPLTQCSGGNNNNNNNNVVGQPSTPLTPSSSSSSQDCLLSNNQLIPSMTMSNSASSGGGVGQQGPSSVSSSCSAPHTPLDSLQASINSQSDPSSTSTSSITTNNGLQRPTNVSTPSSVSFTNNTNNTNSAPSTPASMIQSGGCPPSVGSPSFNRLTPTGDYTPVSSNQSPFANNQSQQPNQTNSANTSTTSTPTTQMNLLSSSPLSVHQQASSTIVDNQICNNMNGNNKNKAINNCTGTNGNNNNNSNKKYCNNRNNNLNGSNNLMPNNNNGGMSMGNFSINQQQPPLMHQSQMPMNSNNSCMGGMNTGPSGNNNMSGMMMGGDSKNQMNPFSSLTPPHNPMMNNNQMPCGPGSSMPNGMPSSASAPPPSSGMVNGNISPFDVDCGPKFMSQFPNEFNPNLPDGCGPQSHVSMPNSCPQPPSRMPSNCHPSMMSGPPPMNMPPSNMMNVGGPNKNMCNMNPNMLPNAGPPPHAPNIKTPPMEGGMSNMGGNGSSGGSGGGQFIQQQNQVFVFDTKMANSAAEAVDQGRSPSIIHFHMNSPITKKFMEKNSIKLQNLNRQPNNAWLAGNIRQPRIRGPNASTNGMPAMMRGNFSNSTNPPCFSPYNHNPPPGPGPGGGNGNAGSPGPGQWNPNWPPSGPPPPNSHHHSHHHGNVTSSFPNDIKMGCGVNPMNTPPMRPQCVPPPPQQYTSNNSSNSGSNFSSQGYPMGCNEDDNLTPQQKQHRENKLAILADLQQKLLQQEQNTSNNRLGPPPQQPPQNSQSSPDHFGPPLMDPMMTSGNSNQSMMYPSMHHSHHHHNQHSDPQMSFKTENIDPHPMNQHGHPPPPSNMNPSEMNFNSNFCPNSMMNSNSNDPWLKSGPGPNFPPIIDETKPFSSAPTSTTNSRRKGSQQQQQNSSHMSPISQQGPINSPNQSCINQSPNNRVPPPPYNPTLHRSMSSPHPGSPATMSLPSPRMTCDSGRQGSYTPGSVRSGPSTPVVLDGTAGPTLINSPKSNSRSNSSPGNSKKNKQQQQQQQSQPQPQQSIDNDLMFGAKSEHSLMPVPSPQQIDYINAFDSQELTIQKQPNAHFQEANDMMIGGNELNNDIFGNDFACPPNQQPNNVPMNNNPRFSSAPCNFDSRYQDNMRFNNGPMMENYNRAPLPPHGMCGTQAGGSVTPTSFNQNDPNSIRFSNCDMKSSRMSGINNGPDMSSFPQSSNSMCDINFVNSIPPINDGMSGPFQNGNGPPPQGPGFNDPSVIDNPINSLQSLQKMAPPFEMMGPNPKSGPSEIMSPNNQMMGPNQKNSGRMSAGNYDSSFGPGPGMNQMPPCSDINDSSNYCGPPPHINQSSNMPPMNYPPNNFSQSPNPSMASNIMPASSDPPFTGPGMHSGSGSFSPMPMNTPPSQPPMVDQNSSNGPSPIPPMMQPSGPGSQGSFGGPRMPPSSNVIRPINPSNNHGQRYNSPNIQVKPDAPNTIQYLPSRPQGPTTTPPNRTPNLDFLQQSLNMGGNKSSGPPSSTYYSSNSTGSMPPNRFGGPRGGAGGPSMMRPQNMNTSGPPGPGLPPASNVCNDMMFNRPSGSGPNHQITNGPNRMPPPTPNSNNFGPNGPLSGPPLPPVTSPIGSAPGPKPAGSNGPVLHPDSFDKFDNDSAYAQQYHNFQQQLYATNTRNSATNNPRMSSNF